MITKFKLYESINEDEPKVGDYVFCNTEFNLDLNLYLDNNIGKITAIDSDYNSLEPYLVNFSNFPEYLSVYKNGENDKYPDDIPFSRDEIINYSNNKEYLEKTIIANKFNI